MPDKPFKMFSPKGRDSSIGISAPRSSDPPMMTDDDPDAMGGKQTAEQAGYMELDGAKKDADCSKVQVDGGISSELGCCNEYSPQNDSQAFQCGTCTFLSNGDSADSSGSGADPTADDAGDQASSQP